MFELDGRIAAATLPLGDTPLSTVRLMDDRRYPWLVLVPRRAGIVELFDLGEADRHALVDEAAAIAAWMRDTFATEKINIATLGNRVRQFHLHLVVRHGRDPAWPDGIWNGSPAVPYPDDERPAIVDLMRGCIDFA